MKKKIRPTGVGFCIYYFLITISFTGLLFAIISTEKYGIEFIIIPAALYIFITEVKDTYILIEDSQITISRRFHSNNKTKVRKDVLQRNEISQVAYGNEIKKQQREQTMRGRKGTYTPKEILCKVGKKYIPFDSKIYSKRNLQEIIGALSTHPDTEIYGSLNDYHT